MARDSGLYSTFVSLMKIALPLGALVLLSSVFLFARSVQIRDTLPEALNHLEENLERQKALSPVYHTTTTDNRPVRVAAAEAEETSTPDVFYARQVIGSMELRRGGTAVMTATNGRLYQRTNIGQFTDGVTIDTSDGYRFVSDTLETDIAQEAARSDTPVLVTGPFGRLEAGAMEIHPRNDPEDRPRAVFTGGVRVLYAPNN